MAPLTNVEVEMEASSIITQVTREEDQITSFAQEKGKHYDLSEPTQLPRTFISGSNQVIRFLVVCLLSLVYLCVCVYREFFLRIYYRATEHKRRLSN